MNDQLKPLRDILLSVRAMIESTNTIAESDLKLIYNDLSDAIMELENTRHSDPDDAKNPLTMAERDLQMIETANRKGFDRCDKMWREKCKKCNEQCEK